jgi:predicted HNH restriction endonuclease
MGLSARIDEILDVLNVMLSNETLSDLRQVAASRVEGTRLVASKRAIAYQTVGDKIVRQLRPDISAVSDFDKQFLAWITDHDTTLKQSIEAHAVDDADMERITIAFDRFDLGEKLLADSFDQELGSQEFEEGKESLRTHVLKERNSALVQRAKEVWEKKDPSLKCRVCGFSFLDHYGERGKGFVEAHHTVPLAIVEPGNATRLEDLAPVCANCHRMLHRKPWVTIEELRVQLSSS